MTRLASFPERHATFREEKYLAALDHPLRSEGRLYFRRPGHLEKTTTAPRPESLVVDGETLTVTRPGTAPVALQLPDQPELEALVDAVRAPLAGDLALMRRHFVVSAEGSLQVWRITLRPGDPGRRHLVQRILVDGNGDDIITIRVEQANGDTQIMQVTEAP
jgi:outer membrane lipoprotein-sorting protein